MVLSIVVFSRDVWVYAEECTCTKWRAQLLEHGVLRRFDFFGGPILSQNELVYPEMMKY